MIGKIFWGTIGTLFVCGIIVGIVSPESKYTPDAQTVAEAPKPIVAPPPDPPPQPVQDNSFHPLASRESLLRAGHILGRAAACGADLTYEMTQIGKHIDQSTGEARGELQLAFTQAMYEGAQDSSLDCTNAKASPAFWDFR